MSLWSFWFQFMKIYVSVYVRTCGPQQGMTSHGHLVGLCPGDCSVGVLVGKHSLPSLARLPLHRVVCDKVVEVVLDGVRLWICYNSHFTDHLDKVAVALINCICASLNATSQDISSGDNMNFIEGNFHREWSWPGKGFQGWITWRQCRMESCATVGWDEVASRLSLRPRPGSSNHFSCEPRSSSSLPPSSRVRTQERPRKRRTDGRVHLVNIEWGIRGRSSQVDAQLGEIAQVTKLKLSFQLVPLVAATASNVARDNLENVMLRKLSNDIFLCL